MKIAVLTIYSGEKFIEDTKYGRRVLVDYCKKHNYDFIDDSTVTKDHDREIQWSKILLIQKYLKYIKDGEDKPYYDYLVWIDADIFIMNPDITIESIIERLMNNKHIMYSKDFGGWVNNGEIQKKLWIIL